MQELSKYEVRFKFKSTVLLKGHKSWLSNELNKQVGTKKDKTTIMCTNIDYQ